MLNTLPLRCPLSLLFLLTITSLPYLCEVKEYNLTEFLTYDNWAFGYNVKLQPFIEEGTFKGFVKILIGNKKAMKTIVLDADPSLQISSSEIFVRDYSEDALEPQLLLNISNVRRDDSIQKIFITMEDELSTDKTYAVEMSFSGLLGTSDKESFFYNTYIDQNSGKERWYLATNLKTGTARKVFPCFDNYVQKTTFNISIAKHKESGLTVLSNSKSDSTKEKENDPEWVWEDFKQIGLMLASSVGVILSSLEKQASRTLQFIAGQEQPVEFRAYGQKNHQTALRSMLDDLVQQLEFQQQYFAWELPMSSVNLVVLPNISFATPVTSWGLIIISEMDVENIWKARQGLLDLWFDHVISPLPNITTIRNSLETFFLCQSGVKEWTPPYTLYYNNAKPQIFQEKRNIQNAWLLRMLNYSITEETFTSGFRRFMLDRFYSIYTDEDLWYFLNRESEYKENLDGRFTVEEIADSWMMTQRYPIVTITRNYEDKSATVEQHTFLRERPHTETQNETQWLIPIMYLTPHNLDPSVTRTVAWMADEKQINISGLPEPEDFIIVNPEEIGMFVVNYDEQNWYLLSQYLQSSNSSEIPVLTRAKLLHDAWNIGYAGELSMEVALNMTLFLTNEKNFAVWEPFLAVIDHVHRYISGTPVETKLEAYIVKMLTSIQTQVDWVKDGYLCQYGYQSCIDNARESYDKWMNSIEKSLNYTVTEHQLCFTFQRGSMEEYEFGISQLKQYSNDKNPQLQQKYTTLLATLASCPLQSEKTNKLLQLMFEQEPNKFTFQDVSVVLNQLANYAAGWTAWFNFLSNNWDSLKERYENDITKWSNMIQTATNHFITQEGLDKVKALHAMYEGQFGSAETVIQQAEEKVAQDVEWSNKNLEIMELWLDNHLK